MMSQYYVGFMAFDSGAAIAHGRTPGSRNGISTTPGYRAIGKLAKDDDYSRAASNKRQAVTKAFQKRRANYSANIANRVGSRGGSAYRRPFIQEVGHQAQRGVNAARRGGRAAGRYVSGVASSAGAGVRRGAAAVGEFFTGRNARRGINSAREQNRMATEAFNRSDNRIVQEAMYKSAIQARRDEREAQARYDRTLPGMVEKAGRKISEMATHAYGKVRDWISGAIGKASQMASGLARKAKVAYGKASIAVGKVARRAMRTVNSIVEKAGTVANKIKAFFMKVKTNYKQRRSTRSNNSAGGNKYRM